MRAWEVRAPGPIESRPLRLSERPEPAPGPHQVRVAVSACAVCRTDLHVAEGDLPVHRPNVIPGHEVVGVVEAVGPETSRLRIGDRVGIAWLGHTDGSCRYCRRGQENLCINAKFTGWDLDGGYADKALVDESYAYRIPTTLSDVQSAPLLCAGIIGYRAFKRCELPPGGTLGIYGFGASAHLMAQLAIRQGIEVHVMTRSEKAQRLAAELGAASVGGAADKPPAPLDASILFAPVGNLVLPALEGLDRGGKLVVAGIYLSQIPALDYDKHLFLERQLRSVTANTRRDGEEFLHLAERLGVVATTTCYAFEEADRALSDLAADRVNGAAVLTLGRD